AELHHDVIAFLTAYGEGVGEAARHVHYGMTSSHLLDTTLALQLVRATELLARRWSGLVGALPDRALEHRDTLCLGRTHGVAAEPTTFGLKLAGHAFAFDRDRRRLAAARNAVAVGTISGAVGTYANLPAEVEGGGAGGCGGGAARAGPDTGGAPRPQRRATGRHGRGGGGHRAPGHRGPPPPAHRGQGG